MEWIIKQRSRGYTIYRPACGLSSPETWAFSTKQEMLEHLGMIMNPPILVPEGAVILGGQQNG